MKETIRENTFENATGKIDYTLMNDYMFHRVMQESSRARAGLVSSLLHIRHEDIHSVIVTNPIEHGKFIDAKTCILDLKILLNSTIIINIELQVEAQSYWDDRSVTYLARIVDDLKKGDNYVELKPTYHIGILNFTLFPDYPEFYATNKMINIKKHYVYNDKFTLNVLDLNQINLATDEDRLWKLDDWARLFKAKTWEELKMLAQKDDVFEETCETIFELNQDDIARYWAEAREEGLRIARTNEKLHKDEIARKDRALAEKDNEIAENKKILAEKDAQIALLMYQLKEKSNI